MLIGVGLSVLYWWVCKERLDCSEFFLWLGDGNFESGVFLFCIDLDVCVLNCNFFNNEIIIVFLIYFCSMLLFYWIKFWIVVNGMWVLWMFF